jgi:hypothetical protein
MWRIRKIKTKIKWMVKRGGRQCMEREGRQRERGIHTYASMILLKIIRDENHQEWCAVDLYGQVKVVERETSCVVV